MVFASLPVATGFSLPLVVADFLDVTVFSQTLVVARVRLVLCMHEGWSHMVNLLSSVTNTLLTIVRRGIEQGRSAGVVTAY